MAQDDFVFEFRYPIQSLKVAEFARAIGEDDGGSGGEDMPVPPTFPIVFTTPFLEVMLVDLLKLDRSRVLHGEQEYVYRRPLRIGDRVIARSRIVEDYHKDGKRGGRMRFVVTETEIRDEATEELIATERGTTIETAPRSGVRDGEDGA
jgi:hypothetical protein